MSDVKCKFARNVYYPPQFVGEIGQVKTFPMHQAQTLVARGDVEIVTKEPQTKEDTDVSGKSTKTKASKV